VKLFWETLRFAGRTSLFWATNIRRVRNCKIQTYICYFLRRIHTETIMHRHTRIYGCSKVEAQFITKATSRV